MKTRGSSPSWSVGLHDEAGLADVVVVLGNTVHPDGSPSARLRARLDKAIAALPPDVTVDVENHPFYLDPNTPPEGYDVGEMLQQKYRREPKAIWARPTSMPVVGTPMISCAPW